MVKLAGCEQKEVSTRKGPPRNSSTNKLAAQRLQMQQITDTADQLVQLETPNTTSSLLVAECQFKVYVVLVLLPVDQYTPCKLIKLILMRINIWRKYKSDKSAHTFITTIFLFKTCELPNEQEAVYYPKSYPKKYPKRYPKRRRRLEAGECCFSGRIRLSMENNTKVLKRVLKVCIYYCSVYYTVHTVHVCTIIVLQCN